MPAKPTKPKNAPVIVIRDGALKASIWENEGENGTYLTTTFAKTYTKDSKPKDTQVFSRSDLLPLSELLRRSYAKIGLHADLKKQEAEGSPSPQAE
jgi:hypothetical protein